MEDMNKNEQEMQKEYKDMKKKEAGKVITFFKAVAPWIGAAGTAALTGFAVSKGSAKTIRSLQAEVTELTSANDKLGSEIVSLGNELNNTKGLLESLKSMVKPADAVNTVKEATEEMKNFF